MSKNINLTLKVWRQDGPSAAGRFETYNANGIAKDASFLEMLDVVNERLIEEGKLPITFDRGRPPEGTPLSPAPLPR